MMKKRDELIERRKYIRLKAPVLVTYSFKGNNKIYQTSAKDISADGIRIESTSRAVPEPGEVEMKLEIPGAANPVHARGRIVWKKKLSLEDNAPFDVGIEFLEIEEDNKNTFLKFLCDVIYTIPKETKYVSKKA